MNNVNVKRKRPRNLTTMELCGGKLPMWCEDYATYLASLPSFVTGTNRASNARIRSLKALRRTLDAMLGQVGWTDIQKATIQSDIRQLARLKTNQDYV